MPKGWVYILLCSNDKFYTGSTVDIVRRLKEHNEGRGANFTKSNLPISLVYSQQYDRIDLAFKREKQIQGWSRQKKMALINGELEQLPTLSKKDFK